MGFALVLSIFLLIGLYYLFRTKQKAKAYGAKLSCSALHISGIPNLKMYTLADLFFTDEKIIIEANKKTFELSYEQLRGVEVLPRTKLIVKDESTFIQAKKKVKGDFLALKYVPSGSRVAKMMLFDTKNFLKARKVAKFLKDKIPSIQEPITNEEGIIKL